MDQVMVSQAGADRATRGRSLLPAVGIAFAALLLSLFFHSPHLWALARPLPGSTYWDRGLQFIQQCDTPIGSPLKDAGLVWRLAPALLAKGLGLHGTSVFLIPWLGLLALLTECAWLVRRRTGDWWLAALTTALIGTTGATLTVTGWWGMNDAWYACALLTISFQPSLVALAAAALIGPWIDERFILALPLALLVRFKTTGAAGKLQPAVAIAALALGAYLTCRLGNLLHLPTAAADDYWRYIRTNFQHWLPWTSLGWFMGLRTAWLLVAVAIGGDWKRSDRSAAWWPGIFAAVPMLVMTILAADSSRSPTMLLPMVVWGAERLSALQGPTKARRTMALLLAANLLLPAMQVTYQNGDVINMLPIELVRWWQHA